MKTFFSLVLVAVVISVAVDHVSGTVPDMDCKQMMSEMTKKQMSGISMCTKKLGYKGKEKSQKMMCLLRCVMQNEGILDDNGMMGAEHFHKFIEEKTPGNLQENIKNTMGKCQEAHADKLKSMEDDPFCKSFDPLIKCFMNSIMQLCPK